MLISYATNIIFSHIKQVTFPKLLVFVFLTSSLVMLRLFSVLTVPIYNAKLCFLVTVCVFFYKDFAPA